MIQIQIQILYSPSFTTRKVSRKRIPAHQLASRPDAFGQTLTWPSRSDPGGFCTIRSVPSLEKKTELKRMQEVGSGMYDPA